MVYPIAVSFSPRRKIPSVFYEVEKIVDVKISKYGTHSVFEKRQFLVKFCHFSKTEWVGAEHVSESLKEFFYRTDQSKGHFGKYFLYFYPDETLINLFFNIRLLHIRSNKRFI